MSSETQKPGEAPRLEGTSLKIVAAALETLKNKGYAGTSAREIARAGDFNQALIFYHFGSVQDLLLAVVDETSARRMEAYRPAFDQATTLPELAQLAREIYKDDIAQGYITVLGEMVAAGATNAELGREVVARMEPWITLVEAKAAGLLNGTFFEQLAPPRDIAFGFIALYLGIDLLTHLQGDRSRAESLLALGEQLSNLAAGFLPSPTTKYSPSIAIEDKDFYKHKGFSFWAIFRTVVTNVLFGQKSRRLNPNPAIHKKRRFNQRKNFYQKNQRTDFGLPVGKKILQRRNLANVL